MDPFPYFRDNDNNIGFNSNIKGIKNISTEKEPMTYILV
jgi:hypothetical protein